ncbi:MAG: thiamine metabolism protein YgfA [Idiomarinaceae bacterium HL-53]|nr:MAG: thiamine metabolism protein YgfA [Idiomarinaceae bacterium HL-53]CUS48356.1 5-formyltetrahydrofolate cyclo-ligase [Idiomarinaceae bacterium HL-53]
MAFELTERQQQNRHAMRSNIRKARMALSERTQHEAALAVSTQLFQLPEFAQAQSVGAYLATSGELSLTPLIEHCWLTQKSVAVPVIDAHEAGKMLFFTYTPSTRMQLNQFAMQEPIPAQANAIALESVHLLCVPLVAFDAQGQRLGMGGGYYDRLLEKWQRGQLPRLFPVGVAHDCQQVEQIPTAPWDIPLPMIITPSKQWRFSLPSV